MKKGKTDLYIAARCPMQTGFEKNAIIFSIRYVEELKTVLEWCLEVIDIAQAIEDFRGATFRSPFWPEWVEITNDKTLGWPETSEWGKIDPSMLANGNRIGGTSHWVVSPAQAFCVIETWDGKTLRSPPISKVLMNEFVTDPLEQLATVGQKGAVKGSPTEPGRYKIQGEANGVKYSEEVTLVPDDALSGRLQVMFKDGGSVPLEQVNPNVEWFALGNVLPEPEDGSPDYR